MIRTGCLAFLATLMLSAVALPVRAGSIPVAAAMDGSQVVPASGSAAAGAASLFYDSGAHKLTSIVVSVTGIDLADVTGFTINSGAVGANGPVLVDLLSFGSFVAMGPSIAYIANNIPFAFEADLLAGNTYLNLATSAFEDGEIRGQLRPVPEPSSAALFGIGALVVGAAARRNRIAA
jgi:hypothetical protein